MASLEQRAANRRNALKSTGPKSALGKRASATNAVRHGLTVPVQASPWGNYLAAVQHLLQTDGFAPHQAQQLALAVLDFERNLHHQRNRYLFSLGLPASGIDPAAAGHEERQMAHALLTDGPTQRSVLPGGRRKAVIQMARFLHRVGQRKQRSAEQELRNADRHLRRAANQLIKACRAAF